MNSNEYFNIGYAMTLISEQLEIFMSEAVCHGFLKFWNACLNLITISLVPGQVIIWTISKAYIGYIISRVNSVKNANFWNSIYVWFLIAQQCTKCSKDYFEKKIFEKNLWFLLKKWIFVKKGMKSSTAGCGSVLKIHSNWSLHSCALNDSILKPGKRGQQKL